MIFNEFRGQKFCFALPFAFALWAASANFPAGFRFTDTSSVKRVVVSSSLLGQARVCDSLGFIIRRVVSFAATCQYQWLPRCVTVSLLIFIACHRQLQSHQFCNRSSSFENATTADPLSQRLNCWHQHWNWSWSQTIAGHVREQCVTNTPWIAGETDLAAYHTRSIATQNTGQD